MLTESEVQSSFRTMFSGGDVDAGTFERAESLLDELRPESPLRFRLMNELDELREVYTSQA